jgi:class 3 adenylate cyclase
MHGVASISQFQKRVDLFNKVDWKNALDCKTFATLSAARYPLRNGLIGFPFCPVAMWGFEPQKSAIRIISGDMRNDPSGLSSKRNQRRASIDFYAAIAPTLLRNARLKPTLEQICNVVRNIRQESEYPQVRYKDVLEDISKNCILNWIDIGEIYVALLFEKDAVRKGLADNEVIGSAVISILKQIGGLIHDYNAFRLPLWRSAPAVMLEGELSDTKWLRNVFADPLSFDPNCSDETDCFFWPWQRCLTATSEPPHSISYRPITTTSLVLDIRASTSAMELTEPPEKFSELIDEIVSTSREIILRHRGYFDKETGDGVSGHFCNRSNVPSIAVERSIVPVEISAIKAGQEIVQKVQSLCLRHQKWLRHGMDKFGAAIGIHSGTAVWLADEIFIRAIGTSIVGAARLCANADSGEIVISNRTFQNAMHDGQEIDGLAFSKKSVTLKEYGDRIGTYAYAARVTA